MSDTNTSNRLKEYLSQILTSGNEAARKEQFLVFLTGLFPDHAAKVRQLASGAEKYIKANFSPHARQNRGFIDSFFGSLVIEFEHAIPKMKSVAENQLRQYIATLWSPPNQFHLYQCIATDGVRWHLYTPRLKEDPNEITIESMGLSPNSIELIENESIDFSKLDPMAVYGWLDRVFFRDNLITPSSQMICTDFGILSHTFTVVGDKLSRQFTIAKSIPGVVYSFSLWGHYLKYTYGDVNANDALFIRHTYLSIVAKILIASVLAKLKNLRLNLKDLDSVINGEYFSKLGILNYSEKDFFSWATLPAFEDDLRDLWRAIFNSLQTYDFRQVKHDFLKGIYQDLVDPEDRHDLGEYYTPDWLCERMTAEFVNVSTDELPAIADITCGSGSFLRSCIIQMKLSLAKTKSKKDIAQKLLQHIYGFEIHPLAVLVAKTNYLLAISDLLKEHPEPIEIPVYLSDSLLVSEIESKESKDYVVLRLASKEFRIPKIIIEEKGLCEQLFLFVDKAAWIVKRNPPNSKTLQDNIIAFLTRSKLDPITESDFAIEQIENLIVFIASTLTEGQANIWAYILKNQYMPIFFKNRFDIILGNPPWLSFRYVNDPNYKRELELLGLKTYQVVPSASKLRTHMEIAIIFLAHAASFYAKENGVISMVMPRSIFSAEHYSKLRNGDYFANFEITNLWDLDEVGPLFRVPSSVITVQKKSKKPIKKLEGKKFSGKLPFQEMHWSDASQYIEESDVIFLKSEMAGRTAFSTQKVAYSSGDRHYAKSFKQGGDIMPRSFFFVACKHNVKDQKAIYCKSSPDIYKTAKKPWKEIEMEGLVDTPFLFKTALATNILPLYIDGLYDIHLPILETGGQFQIVDHDRLDLAGYHDSAAWFRKSFDLYETNKSTVAGTIYAMINYNNKILSQDPRSKYWVLYCASGKNIAAAVFENRKIFFADQVTYYLNPSTRDEAYYVAGVLNAPSLNDLIKPFQSKGLLGQRHVHKKVLDVGIPKFSNENEIMIEIAQVAMETAVKAQDMRDGLSGTLSARRGKIRRNFAQDFSKLDLLVQETFKDHN